MLKQTLQLFVVLLFTTSSIAQLNLNLVGELNYAPSRGDCSDIWGYVDQSGNEYAIVGNETGTSIVDISDPANPTEVFYSPGDQTIWRDMKVWGTTAYITNEGGSGLKIIDLSNLPGAITPSDVYQYTGSTYPFTTAHNIFMDEVGRAYILGANNGVGGAIILDVTTDPLNPVELGRYNDYYMHDVYVRNDTLWGGAINNGFFVAVDVSDPSNCTTIATQATPHTFSHQVWLSDDGNTLFTTDEVADAYIASYDVSDLSNIVELDRIQSSPGQSVIPHNTFVLGDYLVTSYYRDGVTIHDASNPSNMLEVGNYDTSPAFTGDGFNGCWGVYPYLPSGYVIASDIENGLFVLGPTYTPGAYLEGTVTDASTTNPIDNALVEIVSTTNNANTNLAGDYTSGVGVGGTFDVNFSKLGYIPQTISGVVLTSGQTTTVDVQLVPLITYTLEGVVVDENNDPVPNAQVMIHNAQYTNTVTTNGLGEFDIPGFLEDTYDVTIGLWGYHTLCLQNQSLTQSGGPYTYQLTEGYSDIFELDLGWSVSGNAGTGMWERGEPNGTTYSGGEANPDLDSDDCGELAYITGNAGGQAGNDDIDDGTTVLTSPVFDLTNYNNPYLSFERWFFNEGGQGTPNDSLVVELTNGTQTAIIDFADHDDPDEGSWASREVRIEDYVTTSAFMQLKVRAMDQPQGHLAEGGFDNFLIWDSTEVIDDTSAIYELTLASFDVSPVPFTSEVNIQLHNYHSSINVELYELGTGRLVATKTFINTDKATLTGNFAKGMYMIRVYSEEQLLGTKRVVRM